MLDKLIAFLVGAQEDLEQFSNKVDEEKSKYLMNKQVKKAFYVGCFIGLCLGLAFGLNL